MASIWDVQFPVNFTPDGDETKDAVWKHMNELAAIYGHLNSLKEEIRNMDPAKDAGVIDGGTASTEFASVIDGGGA